MNIDYKEFFAGMATEDEYQGVITKERVNEMDVANFPDKYVPGSAGNIKRMIVVSEENVDRVGDSIKVVQEIHDYFYEDPADPCFVTTIIRKIRPKILPL